MSIIPHDLKKKMIKRASSSKAIFFINSHFRHTFGIEYRIMNGWGFDINIYHPRLSIPMIDYGDKDWTKISIYELSYIPLLSSDRMYFT